MREKFKHSAGTNHVLPPQPSLQSKYVIAYKELNTTHAVISYYPLIDTLKNILNYTLHSKTSTNTCIN
ncbi:hypothetical protein Cri9333_4816 (plasmid) [Crinalium epipsammum PCC 9333]|uniref:Uncharacterized protein n=1 Tax=Crinalium epipsammum PCC 9333 TaxID=1173022 RepID=K9W5H4_9CYAN|nr:hypothetical protein Cri9333_4816 [Crinalium epipsammum PCC 9333]